MSASTPDPNTVVVVSRRLPAAVEERLGGLFDVRFNRDDLPMDREALRSALQGADGLLVTVTDRLDADVLRCADRARIIANFGVGYDHIDLSAARERGIVVTNTPGVLTDDTADLAIALMLMAARRAGEGERELRRGDWSGWRPTHLLGARVSGATLGIVGMGRIGQAVARRARYGFGMRVLYHQPTPVSVDPDLASPCATLEDLLAQSDIVSVHCRSTTETRHLIDAAALERMRPTAILVNTARGEVVDEAALARALAAGTIAAAGLDVYEHEPQVNPDLLATENVVLLPHLGSATEATRIAMGMRAVDNLVAFFSGRTAPDAV